MKVVLVRHGKTNKQKVVDGFPVLNGSQGNVDLQGYSLGKFLPKLANQLFHKGVNLWTEFRYFNGFYASTLKRTRQTLQGIIAVEKIPVANIVHSPLIEERDYGFLASSVSHGISNRALYLEVIPNRFPDLLQEEVTREDGTAIRGVASIATLRDLFPDEIRGLFSSNKLDYLRVIINSEKGYSKIAPITAYSDLSGGIDLQGELAGLGIEPTSNIVDRLDEFETYLKKNHGSNDIVLVGSHGDIMGTWLKKIKEQPELYTDDCIQAQQQWDSLNEHRKHGEFRVFDYLEHFCVELK